MKNHYKKVNGSGNLYEIPTFKDKVTGLLCLDLTKAPTECAMLFGSLARKWTSAFWGRDNFINNDLAYEFIMSVPHILWELPAVDRIAACEEAKESSQKIENMADKHRFMAYLLKAIPDLNKHKLIKINLPTP